MGKWANPEEWAKLCSGETCYICAGGWGGPWPFIAELGASWLASSEDGPLRGYCCLFVKRHAVELHDLTEAEGAAYMGDIQKVSRALKTVTGAVKMNYDIHGNLLPHIHTHFYPRHVGDPWQGTSIHGRAVPTPVYAPGEFGEFVARLKNALAEQQTGQAPSPVPTFEEKVAETMRRAVKVGAEPLPAQTCEATQWTRWDDKYGIGGLPWGVEQGDERAAATLGQMTDEELERHCAPGPNGGPGDWALNRIRIVRAAWQEALRDHARG